MTTAWRQLRISQVALGKYIILYACILHLMWAILLLINPMAGNATALAILLQIFGGPIRTAVILFVVAVTAMWFPFLRYTVSKRALAFMLIPQQLVMLMSAGNGIYAAAVGHFSDGVARAHEFILADQLSVILLALLYSVAILEAASWAPKHRPMDLGPMGRNELRRDIEDAEGSGT